MMKSHAVICELNPMHNGHKYIFDSIGSDATESSVKIAVMSGNFTQRCTPAVFDKYTRAEAALDSADLVVELPFPWCASGAEEFAFGGVYTAAGVGASSLTFGSESGEIELLRTAAGIKNSGAYVKAVTRTERENRITGSAVNFDTVMREFGIEKPLGANDKLASEYIRFGESAGIGKFSAVRRLTGIKSATQLREIIFGSGAVSLADAIPPHAYEIFSSKQAEICTETRYNDILFTYCRTAINDSEENDILRYARTAAREVRTADAFVKNLPTKKYTLARMRREVLHAMLGVRAEDRKTPPQFTVLLAANGRGREYLAELRRKESGIPVITKPADTESLSDTAKRQCGISYAADELYALCVGERADCFMKKHPVIR